MDHADFGSVQNRDAIDCEGAEQEGAAHVVATSCAWRSAIFAADARELRALRRTIGGKAARGK
ncbi:hypothetical protein CR492_04160 [Methylocella silvestris]|uniref:Uncharacterized protein n=1 Tax=Methylocella silvestris TaxID=199596 RepID=A0A2J7TKM9_METSI|nr:hypothetical protein CR492_04160 [Methylocella silvestris]